MHYDVECWREPHLGPDAGFRADIHSPLLHIRRPFWDNPRLANSPIYDLPRLCENVPHDLTAGQRRWNEITLRL